MESAIMRCSASLLLVLFVFQAVSHLPADAQQQVKSLRDQELKAKTTKALVDDLSANDPEFHDAATGELASRGKDVMPEVLKSIESGADINSFVYLFAVLGRNAEAALPLLISQLTNKDHVYTAVMFIDVIKPGTLASLPETTKQQAANSLYEATILADYTMVASHVTVLAKIGKPAAPALLNLLRHPNADIRFFTAEALTNAQFSDQQLESQLWILSNSDERLTVREAAIRAIGYFTKPDRNARAALLAFIKNPPPYNPRDTNEKKIEEMNIWRRTADRAARTLARFGPVIIDDLVPLLSPFEAPQRLPAMTAFESLGPSAILRLIELQSHEDRSVANSASAALDLIWNRAVVWAFAPDAEDVLPALYAVAGSEKSKDETRLSAAFFALRIDTEQSRKSQDVVSIVPVLTPILENGSFKHQCWAANVARDLGPAARDALPALRRRLDAPLPTTNTNGFPLDHVRKQVQAAIAAIEANAPR